MSIKQRLTRLEAQKGEIGNPEQEHDAEAFNAKLARIEGNVRAGGRLQKSARRRAR